MNNDRELLQQALDALQGNWRTDESDKAIEALRARLAQPENDFNPDWDAMAVMVEEQQRMAKRIEELEARLSQPEPAQCDGGQCGIGGYCKQCPKTQPEPEPVAWGVPNTRPTEKAQFMMLLHSTDGVQYPELLVPFYTAPPQREWVGLTDEEINILFKNSLKSIPTGVIWNISRTIEAKLKEKNT